MDLSALPKSDSAFILEQLPSMNLTRQNHQLLHYRSSAGDFELLIALCGSLIRSGSAADAGASHLFPKLEFLDLQRLSLGWVLVETDQDAHFYTKYRLGHKFIVIGDSIIAFGRHMAYDRQCLLVSFDLRYITEELSRQLPIRESMPPIISDKSPMKLLLNGKCCWKLDAEAYQYLAYGSYSDKMFFLSRLPRY